MYTTSAPRVRDPSAEYGPHEVGSDEFPAASILKDLPGAPEEEVPRILARYAALRCWLLRDDGADSALVEHAARTARAYLEAVPGWPEREPLERLTATEPALAAARDAGRTAAAAGHTEGAYALYRAGYLAARRRAELRWAARLAAAIASLLGQAGIDGEELWSRRARRLRRSIRDP